MVVVVTVLIPHLVPTYKESVNRKLNVEVVTAQFLIFVPVQQPLNVFVVPLAVVLLVEPNVIKTESAHLAM